MENVTFCLVILCSGFKCMFYMYSFIHSLSYLAMYSFISLFTYWIQLIIYLLIYLFVFKCSKRRKRKKIVKRLGYVCYEVCCKWKGFSLNCFPFELSGLQIDCFNQKSRRILNPISRRS